VGQIHFSPLSEVPDPDDCQIGLGIQLSRLGTTKLFYTLRTIAPNDDSDKELSEFDESQGI